MKRILFVCHGNICRSPMAEFVMKNLVVEAGLSDDFFIDSKATSTEEIGNDMYPPAKAKLRERGIPFARRAARQISKSDYDSFDLIIGMDRANMNNINRMLGPDTDGKFHKLLEWTGSAGDIADPWYTDDFDTTYSQVDTGCRALLKFITETE
ncbi:MAG: low molecular weight phosphotyrosine protein phosphatase [Treponema sp.]|nr:low molecular weight phosphotyrosine protein phosphatase [Treponema sp.]